MCMPRFRRTLIKALLFIAAFIPIHFAYDWSPSAFTALISENGGESIFMHMKIGFWAWATASIIEFLIWARRAPRRLPFVESRMFGMVLIPYVQTVIWYLAPAIVGRIGSAPLEVAWSVLACFASGVATSVIEWDMENAPSTAARKITLCSLLAICLFLFIRFTYGDAPWVDVFASPAD